MREEISKHQIELKGLTENYQDFYDEREMERLQLKIGQVAYVVENAIVNEVLAGLTNSNPHINSIVELEKAIKGKSNFVDVFNTNEDRECAGRRWKELKHNLKWSHSHHRYIIELKGNRIPIAHPTFDEHSLREALDRGGLQNVVRDEKLFRDFLDMVAYMKN